MKKDFYNQKFFLSLLGCFLPVILFGQIYTNTFTGAASGCPTAGNLPVTAANSTGTGLVRETMNCASASGYFNSTTLNNSATINESSYVEFSVTANPGFQLNINSLSFFRQGSITAPNQLEVRFSTDGFTTFTSWGGAPVTKTSPGETTLWDFPDFSTALGGTVTFRIYPYGTARSDGTTGTAAASGTFRLKNIVLNGSVTNMLPVKLISFDGHVDENIALLKWTTAWEEDNKGFGIEKSNDALFFKEIGYVKGNVSVYSQSGYEFIDSDIRPGQTYYFRLRQEDLDGRTEFSRIIPVKAPLSTINASIFPNPNHGNFTLSTENVNDITFKVYNSSGVEIPVTTSPGEGKGSLMIKAKTDLLPGLYHLRINSDTAISQPKSLKLVIN